MALREAAPRMAEGPLSAGFRQQVRPGDPEAVRSLVERTRFFRPAEIEIAAELVGETLAEGEMAGYQFLFADGRGQLDGYACFGRVPMTASSWDLYWIAVDPDIQGRGLGRRLLGEVERAVGIAGGGSLWVETSGKELYLPTRQFYRGRGYLEAARLAGFYAPGDDKVIFTKRLDLPAGRSR